MHLLRDLTDSENEAIDAHVKKLVSEFKGDIGHLSSALGCLAIARAYGWKVARLVTSPMSYRRHQKILGIEFKDVLLAKTTLSKKSLGLDIVETVGNFFDVCAGKAKIDSVEKTSIV